MDEAALAKQRAEARRQKILAKQKDRLAGITGVYSSATTDPEPAAAVEGPALDAQHSVSPPPPAAGTAAASLKATGAAEAAGSAAGKAAAAAAGGGGRGAMEQLPASDLQAQVVGQLLQDVLASPRMQQDQQQHEAAAAAATGMRLRKPLGTSDQPAAAAVAGGVDPPLDTLLNSFMQPSSSRSSGGGSSSIIGGSSSSSQEPGATAPLVPAVVRYSRAVTLAVRDSALLRLLSAALLAYAAVSGTYGPLEYPVRLPPVAVLWLLHAAVIATVALGYILLKPGALLVDPNTASSSSGALPMRLRTINLMALVPGLTELSSVLGGYQQLLAALSVDAATHVVALGLLLSQR